MHRNNTPVLSSSSGRYKNKNDSNGIESEVTATQGMSPVLQAAGRYNRNEAVVWASG